MLFFVALYENVKITFLSRFHGVKLVSIHNEIDFAQFAESVKE